jgi:hypothetical protein
MKIKETFSHMKVYNGFKESKNIILNKHVSNPDFKMGQ